jgi:hypothetical protein
VMVKSLLFWLVNASYIAAAGHFVKYFLITSSDD